MVKLFIVYRIRKILVYNNEQIKHDDRILSNKIFNKFDDLILIKENQLLNEKNNLEDKEENKNEGINQDNNEELSDDLEQKFQMWNFAKKNLSTVLYSIFSEYEE